MENTVIKFKWFWAWQDDKEEQWLEDMSAQGLHLVEPGFFGRYIFSEGEPKHYVYRMDFMSGTSDQMEAYLQCFTDAGWEYLGQFGSWQYFRILTDGKQNREIFTDTASKIDKYRRILRILQICFLIYLLPLRVLFANTPGWIIDVALIIWILLLVLFVIGAYKIYSRIQQLREDIRQ